MADQRAGWRRLRPWLFSAVAVAVALTLASWLGWWGLLLFVPIGFTIGFVDAEIERRERRNV